MCGCGGDAGTSAMGPCFRALNLRIWVPGRAEPSDRSHRYLRVVGAACFICTCVAHAGKVALTAHAGGHCSAGIDQLPCGALRALGGACAIEELKGAVAADCGVVCQERRRAYTSEARQVAAYPGCSGTCWCVNQSCRVCSRIADSATSARDKTGSMPCSADGAKRCMLHHS